MVKPQDFIQSDSKVTKTLQVATRKKVYLRQ